MSISPQAAQPPADGLEVTALRLIGSTARRPLLGVGGFMVLALQTLTTSVTRRFAWREFLEQMWFLARVSAVPALMLSIPYVVMAAFTFNILLIEFGGADFSGTGAALSAVNQIGPLVTVLVVTGAGASAMCADLGARTIREEIDALKVMGVDPIQALIVPRVAAATVTALLLSAVVTLVGLVGAFFFSVYFQHVTPGAFVASMTLITGTSDVIVSTVKAALFGLSAGLIACHQGTTVKGGPAGVGNAVNETVVVSFVLLFVINIIVTAIGFKVTA
jgi:phospholipid/cholesterol/gamma-HCH transport system permease protein